MLLKYWTAIVFSLWVWGPQHSQQDAGSASKCAIQASPDPQYVAAYRMHYRAGRGCAFNSSEDGQKVHVINLKLPAARDGHLNARPPVTLVIEPRVSAEEDGQKSGGVEEERKERKLVFVLNSLHPVKWKVEVSLLLPPHTSLRFMVQSHSVIRFRKRKGRQQLRGRRRSMPRADDEHNFLSWVRRRLKVVTSYSELNGDKLLFYLQHGGVVSGECRLNEMKASPFALVAQREQQAVTGCISTGSKNVLDRPVYVIELLGVGEVEEKGGEEAGVEGVRKGGGQVELDIGSASGKKMEHDFYLVLRSPPTVKWVLRTHRLNGWIDVVTNADADLRGIHMHTVALRRELMEASGAELIDWTEYYVAPVRAYTAVTAANILQLRLPAQDAKAGQPWAAPVLTSQAGSEGGGVKQRENPSTDMRDHLKHIIQTRCQGGTMEVTLPAVLTQELDLSVDQLSLLDRDCQAVRNSSHIIFLTPLDQCGTRTMAVDDDHVYSNAIVIHASGMVGAILEEELGSGYFDLQGPSGSGWMEEEEGEGGADSSTTYLDDEDLTAHKVHIDVECRLPRTPEGHTRQGQVAGAREDEGVCTMQVFADPMFLQRVTHFPHTTSTHTGVYLQASAPSDPNLHVLMENCWVTPWASPQHSDPQHKDPQHTVLIQQGCTRSPAVHWVRYPTGGATPAHSQGHTTPERLMIYSYLPPGSYIHCQLARCFKGTSGPGHKCPPDPSDHCNSQVLPNMFPQLQTQTCGVHTVGPIHITQREVRIGDDHKLTGSMTPDPGARSRPADREGQLQQSVIIEGLDSGTVVGIAFAAFVIGILLTGALWFIHTHTGPSKRSAMSTVVMGGMSGEVTPNSSCPISA